MTGLCQVNITVAKFAVQKILVYRSNFCWKSLHRKSFPLNTSVNVNKSANICGYIQITKQIYKGKHFRQCLVQLKVSTKQFVESILVLVRMYLFYCKWENSQIDWCSENENNKPNVRQNRFCYSLISIILLCGKINLLIFVNMKPSTLTFSK